MRVLILQFRVVAALVLRETRMTFGTSQIGYLWAILQPAATVAVMVILFSLIRRQPPFGTSLALFFATAILTLEMYNKFSVSLMRGFTSNKALLTYPMIRETDTLMARTVLITSIFSIIYLLFYGALVGLGYAPLPAYPERILAAFGATAFLGFGVGTINAVIYVHINAWQHVEKVIARPLFFLSAVFTSRATCRHRRLQSLSGTLCCTWWNGFVLDTIQTTTVKFLTSSTHWPSRWS